MTRWQRIKSSMKFTFTKKQAMLAVVIGITLGIIVAAIMTRFSPQLPPEIVAWVDGRKLTEDDELVGLAKTVIAAVQHPSKSELAQLWGESGQYLADWKAGLSDLKQRLQ